MTNLTEKQISFLRTHLKIPLIFGRKAAKNKRDQWSGEFRDFNTHCDSVRAAASQVQDSTVRSLMNSHIGSAEAIVMDDTKTPNFSGGHAKLDDIDRAVANQCLHEECQAELDRIKPIYDRVMALNPVNAGEIMMTWDFANQKAASGRANSNRDDFQVAKAAASQTQDLLMVIVAEDDLVREKARREARVPFDIQAKRYEALKSIISSLAGGAPPALDQQMNTIEATLAGAENAEADAIITATGTATSQIDKLEGDSEPVIDLANKYEDKRGALASGAFAVLTAHTAAADELMTTEIADVTKRIADAADAAARHNYQEALDEIKGAEADTTRVLKLADAVVRHQQLKADREQRMTDLADKVKNPDIHEAVKAANKICTDMWAEVQAAFADKSLPKIEATTDHMTALPGAIEETIVLNKLAADFLRLFKEVEDYADQAENDIASFDEVEKEELQLQITGMRTMLADCAYAKTKDIRTSTTIAHRAYSLSDLIYHKVSAANLYRDSKTAFSERLAEMLKVEGKPVGAPVVDYLAQLKASEMHAVARISKGDFAAAKRVYDASAAVHADKQNLVRWAKDYVEGVKWFDSKIGGVEGLPGAGDAADEITAAKELKTQATAAKDAKEWESASFLIKRAKPRLQGAERLAKAAKAMETAKAGADAAVNDMKDNLDSAVDKANSMIDAFKSSMGDAATAEDWANDLRTKVQAAAAMDMSDPGKLAAAQAAMRDAMAQIEYFLTLGAAYEAFDKELSLAKDDKQTLDDKKAKPWDADTEFDTEMGEIDTLIAEAEAAGDFSVADYATAATKLKEALAKIGYVFENYRAAGVALKTQQSAADILVELDEPWTQAHEATELNGVKADKAALDLDITNRNYIKARELGEALEKRAKGFKTLANNHWWYEKYVKDHLEPAITALPAKQIYSKVERDHITEIQAQITSLAAAHDYISAQRLIFAVERESNKCVALEADGAAYTPKRDAAKQDLDKMEADIDPKVAGLYEKFLDLRSAFVDAESVATGKHFKDAQARMEKISADIAALNPNIDNYKTYTTTRTETGQSIADIGKLRDMEVIGPMVKRIFGKHKNAIKVGDSGDHTTATDLFIEIRRECNTALRAILNQQEYGELVDDLKDLAGTDAEGLETGIRRAEGFLNPLKSGDGAVYVFKELGQAVSELESARAHQTDDPAKSCQHLEKVMALCEQAELALVQFTQMRENAKATTDKMDAFLASEIPGFIRSDMEKQRTAIETIMDAVAKQPAKKDEALNIIESASAEYHRLRLAAKQQLKVESVEAAILARMDEMDKHPQRFAIADDIALIRTALASAKSAAAEYKQDRALEVLNRAKARQDDALMNAVIQGGGVPDQAQLKDLLARPDGAERLDDLVDGLDAKTQRKVMNEVFKARFGTELQIFKDSEYAKKGFEKYLKDNSSASAADIQDAKDKVDNGTMKYDDFIDYLKGECTESPDDVNAKKQDLEDMGSLTPAAYKDKKMEEFRNATPTPDAAQIAAREAEIDALTASMNFDMAPEEKAPNLRRFYDLMSKLPDTDTLTNESLGIFTLKTGATDAPYYSDNSREVVMIGEESDSPYMSVGLALELGEVDEDCTPELGEKMTLLSWNTLHEVGHAVDDKLGFMNRRGSELAGWKSHGSDIKPIADKIARKYQYDADYIAAYMGGNANPKLPSPEAGVDELIWDLRRADAIAHVDSIRESSEAWQSDAGAKFSEIDGRCYHEAYGNDWYSYPLNARAKGVSGYQFRAPGEWFSELYAAYHSGKMNQNHPARDWLETL